MRKRYSGGERGAAGVLVDLLGDDRAGLEQKKIIAASGDMLTDEQATGSDANDTGNGHQHINKTIHSLLRVRQRSPR